MSIKVKIELTKEQEKLYRETASDLVGEANQEEANKKRSEWAAQFGDMLRRTIQIGGTVRDIYDVRVKEKGEMRFLIEPNDITAWVMPKVGEFARNYIEADVVYIPTDVHASSVYYALDFARDADMNVPSIALNKLNQAMLRLEETQGWMLIRAAVNNAPAVQRIQVANGTPGAGHFSKVLFNLMLLYFEREQKVLNTYYLPPEAMADIRGWTQTQIDETTQRQIFQAGGMASIWNIQLQPIPLIRYYATVEDKKNRNRTYIDRLFDPNDKLENGSDVWSSAAKTAYANGTLQVCYGIAKTDFGIMAIKEQMVTVNDPVAITRWEQGILARMRLGFAIIDSENVVMGIVDRTHTP